jgi:hypothetical protein
MHFANRLALTKAAPEAGVKYLLNFPPPLRRHIVGYRCILPVAAFLFFASSMVPQTPRGFPTPPPSLDQEKQAQAPGQNPSPAARRTDLEKAQREADELARMAQSVPADVTKVRAGMLPKDAIEKLKQIEKLSKHLRVQLNP